MNSAKINAALSKDGNTTIQIQGDSFDVGVLLMHIIQQIAEADEGIVFSSLICGIDKTDCQVQPKYVSMYPYMSMYVLDFLSFFHFPFSLAHKELKNSMPITWLEPERRVQITKLFPLIPCSYQPRLLHR